MRGAAGIIAGVTDLPNSAAGRARRWFLAALVLTLAFKLWLAIVLPMTGDEAYFISWGVYPDWGYYDHPPMIGWVLALLLQISRSEWVLRLPVILLPALLALAILRYLKPVDEEKAHLAALCFLVVPANVWNVLITTDTPLVLFSFLSVLCFAGAVRGPHRIALYASSGALLGLAFLSKYFAALLGFSYLVFVLAQPAGRRDWRGLAMVFACVLPFAAINAWWNYEHCWANLMFNVYNRHDDAGWSLRTPALYAASVLYMLSPVALYQLWRDRAGLGARMDEPDLRVFMFAWAVPLAVFAALSPVKQIGLHWLLSFVPFFFIAMALLLSAEQLRRSAIYLFALSTIHMTAIGIGSLLPIETWKSSKLYDGIVFHVKTAELLQRLEAYAEKYQFAADGYSPAVTASYASGKYFFVFGTASSHGRHDDILTDFRALSGKNILVLRKNPPEPGEYAPYFAAVEYKQVELYGVTFHIVLGQGFDYLRYRERVLRPIRDRYYRIPSYLPQGGCYFCERYFPDEPWPTR